MKFVCEVCGARYYIDDNKVRGKVLRIRCKKCSHIMSVRGLDRPETSTDQAPFARRRATEVRRAIGSGDRIENLRRSLATDANVAVGAGEEPPAVEHWYYAINGETYGPYSEDELIERFGDGRIGDEAYVWQQGFEEWKPAYQIPVFQTAIARSRDVVRRRKRPRTVQLDAADLAAMQRAADDELARRTGTTTPSGVEAVAPADALQRATPATPATPASAPTDDTSGSGVGDAATIPAVQPGVDIRDQLAAEIAGALDGDGEGDEGRLASDTRPRMASHDFSVPGREVRERTSNRPGLRPFREPERTAGHSAVTEPIAESRAPSEERADRGNAASEAVKQRLGTLREGLRKRTTEEGEPVRRGFRHVQMDGEALPDPATEAAMAAATVPSIQLPDTITRLAASEKAQIADAVVVEENEPIADAVIADAEPQTDDGVDGDLDDMLGDVDLSEADERISDPHEAADEQDAGDAEGSAAPPPISAAAAAAPTVPLPRPAPEMLADDTVEADRPAADADSAEAEADATVEADAPALSEDEDTAEADAPEAADADATVEAEAPEEADADATVEAEAPEAADADAAVEAEAPEAADADATVEADAPALSEDEDTAEAKAPENADADATVEAEAPDDADAEADATVEAEAPAPADEDGADAADDDTTSELRDPGAAIEELADDLLEPAADASDDGEDAVAVAELDETELSPVDGEAGEPDDAPTDVAEDEHDDIIAAIAAHEVSTSASRPAISHTEAHIAVAKQASGRGVVIMAVIALFLIGIVITIAIARSGEEPAPTEPPVDEVAAEQTEEPPAPSELSPDARRVMEQNLRVAMLRATDRVDRAWDDAFVAVAEAIGPDSMEGTVSAHRLAEVQERRTQARRDDDRAPTRRQAPDRFQPASRDGSTTERTASAPSRVTIGGTEGGSSIVIGATSNAPDRSSALRPELGRGGDRGPGPEHFTAGLRSDVEPSLQQCHQRHRGEEGELPQSRISLRITVEPTGRVSDVTVDRSLRDSAFDRCLQTRRDRWSFPPFEGDPVTLDKTYLLQ